MILINMTERDKIVLTPFLTYITMVARHINAYIQQKEIRLGQA